MRKPERPCIIDIEASGFGSHSYPIEIGVINAKGERYCALIKPDADWTHWNPDAEKIHGISRELLATCGRPPAQICLELNAFLQGSNAYSDAWSHDSPWLNRLFYAGRIKANFFLSAIELIATEAQLMLWDNTTNHLTKSPIIQRHRASGDAFLIQQTYIATRLATTVTSQAFAYIDTDLSTPAHQITSNTPQISTSKDTSAPEKTLDLPRNQGRHKH